jgi:hypothetical protein
VFSRSGELWVVFEEGDGIFVSRSKDLGKTFARATRVTPETEAVDANGEGRPKIAIGSSDQIYVTWTRKKEKAYTGELRFSRSTDHGATFSPPRPVVNDEAGQRFDTLGVAPNGDVVLAWVDKRDAEREKAANKPYSGAAVYFAVSSDAGSTFRTPKKVKDNTCECCCLALGFDSSGTPVLLWRDVMNGSIRDHSIAWLNEEKGPETLRVSFDDWKLDGCPHHGPSMSIASNGTIHLAWFTGDGRSGSGVFYSNVKNRQVSPARRFGTRLSGRPEVLGIGKQVFMLWKEENPNGSALQFAISNDDGRTWSESRVLATTTGSSDHPILITNGKNAFLSWFTQQEGYIFVPVTPAALPLSTHYSALSTY